MEEVKKNNTSIYNIS